MLELKEVNVLDKNAEALGVPTSVLMENAGRGVAEFVTGNLIESGDIANEHPKIVIFCGPGNNGGDGFVVARYLKGTGDVVLVLATSPDDIRTELAKENYKKVHKDVTVLEQPEKEEVQKLLDDADVIIDALLGVGISGTLKEPYATYVSAIEASRALVVSVDAPTGLGTGTRLTPDYTVTFHAAKTGMNGKNSGEIAVVDIGIPEDAEKFVGPGELAVYYPKPESSSHKGQNGRLLIVGGGPYTGAPALAAFAALRTGVDLVHIATPSRAVAPIAGYSPNFIVHELTGGGGKVIGQDDLKTVLDLCAMADACVLGPGIGRDEDSFKFVKSFLAKCPIPVVVDADALSAIDSKSCAKTRRPSAGWIVTPHKNEFKRLTDACLGRGVGGKKDKGSAKKKEGEKIDELCNALATKLGAVVALKGKTDLVCDGERHKFNRTGNPGMTVGGTGDILAGIIGGLVAKDVGLFNAARIGVFMSGYAGDLVWREKGPSMMATDILETIPWVLMEFVEF